MYGYGNGNDVFYHSLRIVLLSFLGWVINDLSILLTLLKDKCPFFLVFHLFWEGTVVGLVYVCVFLKSFLSCVIPTKIVFNVFSQQEMLDLSFLQ